MEEMNRYQIQRFDVSRIRPNSVVVFIGRRGSGKTTAIREVLYRNRHIPTATVFSPTEESNGDWTGHVPSLFVHPTYRPEVVQNIIARQSELARRSKVDKRVQQSPTVLLLEDCMYEKKKVLGTPELRNVMMNGRHWNILLLMSLQYVMDITPDMRPQFNFVFLFRDNNIGNKERCHRNWGGMIPFDAFVEFFDKLTEGTGPADRGNAMVIDVDSLSNNVEDCIFWFKAPRREPRSFRVGSPAYWRFASRNTVPLDPARRPRTAQQRPRRKGPHLKIERK